MPSLSVFRSNITPPLGHPLCAGWYPKAEGLANSLSALGVVIYPDHQQPIVLCVLDWAELSNSDHRAWRTHLAAQAGTEPDRVTVHCVHCHDAPWPDQEAQKILDRLGHPGVIMDVEWCRQSLEQTGLALAAAQKETFTHFAWGSAEVEKIASNRRVMGEDGKVRGIRWTRCRDESLRAAPEGIIDPALETVSFWRGPQKLVSLHYYSVHPTSYDGTGQITHDFVGIAREKLSAEEGVPHLYFTGCAGNITPGKYNDGVADNRALFTQRIEEAMKRSESAAVLSPIEDLEWRCAPVRLPWQDASSEAALRSLLADPKADLRNKSRAALSLSYKDSSDKQEPIIISALHLNGDSAIVHLPAEAFIEYQLFARSLRTHDRLAVAAYGDCGPGYIPLARSYAEGGYEPQDSFCSPESEQRLKDALVQVLGANAST